MSKSRLSLGLMLQYLIGRREAIETMASSRATIWLGFFFVLISGVAREYDQEYIFHFITPFFYPLFFSVPLAFAFFVFVYQVYVLKDTGERFAFWKSWWSFLGLFWMTAPLAWLYALPVEWFLDSVTAVKVNLLLLGIVATWRVVLFARVLSVLLQQPLRFLLFNTLFGGSVIAIFAILYMPVSLVGFMGGMIHSPETEVIIKVTGSAWGLAWMIALFTSVATVFSIVIARRKELHPFPLRREPGRLPLGAMAIIAIAAAGILIPAQRVLARNIEIEALYKAKDYRGHLDALIAHGPSAFAPTRHIPPDPYRIYRAKPVFDLFHALEDSDPAWVRDRVFFDLGIVIQRRRGVSGSRADFVALLRKMGGTEAGRAWLDEHKKPLESAVNYGVHAGDHDELGDEAWEAVLREFGLLSNPSAAQPGLNHR
ncbi:MAG: hypothetical protein AAF492_12750 [Verrucomicrobiota bacterium]